MISAGSALTLRRVPMTAVRLRSNNNAEALDDYFAAFHATLLAGGDCPPVWLLAEDSGMFVLMDGRKRFAAAVLAGRSEILAVVEEREASGG